MQYDVLFNGKVVGAAEVHTQGMYYVIRCSCDRPGPERYRLYLSSGGTCRDLGICVPNGQKLACFSRVGKKTVCDKDMYFYVASSPQTDNFLEIDPEKPMQRLEQLENARFCIHDGVKGLRFPGGSSGDGL